MHIRGVLTVIAAGVILSGCVTESSYKQAQEIVRGSPAMKRDAINKCYSGASRASPARKAEMAKIMKSARAAMSRAPIAHAPSTASPAAASPMRTSAPRAPGSSASFRAGDCRRRQEPAGLMRARSGSRSAVAQVTHYRSVGMRPLPEPGWRDPQIPTALNQNAREILFLFLRQQSAGLAAAA